MFLFWFNVGGWNNKKSILSFYLFLFVLFFVQLEYFRSEGKKKIIKWMLIFYCTVFFFDSYYTTASARQVLSFQKYKTYVLIKQCHGLELSFFVFFFIQCINWSTANTYILEVFINACKTSKLVWKDMIIYIDLL